MSEVTPVTPNDRPDKRPPTPPVDKQATAATQAAWNDRQQSSRQAAIADARQPNRPADAEKGHARRAAEAAHPTGAAERGRSAAGSPDRAHPAPADRGHAGTPADKSGTPGDRSGGGPANWGDRHESSRSAAIAEARQAPARGGEQATAEHRGAERVAGPVLSGEDLRHDLNQRFMKAGLVPQQAADFKQTPFERRVSDGDLKGSFTPKFDPKTGDAAGFGYDTSGFHADVDRDGKRVSSSEIPLQKPAVDPIDVIGPGEVKLAGKLAEAAGRAVVGEVGKLAERMAGRAFAENVARDTVTTAARDTATTAVREAGGRAAQETAGSAARDTAARGAPEAGGRAAHDGTAAGRETLREGASDATHPDARRGADAAARFLGTDSAAQTGRRGAETAGETTAGAGRREGARAAAGESAHTPGAEGPHGPGGERAHGPGVDGPHGPGGERSAPDRTVDDIVGGIREEPTPQPGTYVESGVGRSHEARATLGESTMAFAYGERGSWAFLEGPSGAGGHPWNAAGFDGVAFRPAAEGGGLEVRILDNKAYTATRNVGDASAVTRNLKQNLDGLAGRIADSRFDSVPRIGELRDAIHGAADAARLGQKLPDNVRISITTFGGNSAGVTERLDKLRVKFDGTDTK
jgi:hypothetical protein